MAHILTPYGGYYKPQDLALDKIDSQKMFIDNINKQESNFINIKQSIHSQVIDLAALKAVDTSDTTIFVDGVIIVVMSLGLFKFSRNSTATADDVKVVTPSVGGGRWLSLFADINPTSIGAVQGNTKAWVATAATPDPNYPNTGWRLTIPNFVFSEGCQVTFFATTAPDGSVWDNITINGDSNLCFALRALIHDVISSDSWAANTTITLSLSRQKINMGNSGDERSGTAFFKGGAGAVGELFQAPISEQTSAPTPLNTNHLWIHNDRKMPITIDEAIRASEWAGQDRYFAIVDSTDNNYMHYVSSKKLTDGTVCEMVNRHIARDAVPWDLGWHQFGKKNGIDYLCDNKCKWPRIYSRINGVIDLEDAQRWNGSAWEWLSQKGHYLFVTAPVGQTNSFNRTNNVLTPHANIINLQHSYAAGFSVSPDHNYVAVVDGAEFYIIKRVGDSFSTIYHETLPYSPQSAPAWSPDSMYVGTTCSSNIFKVYRKDTADSFSHYTDLGTNGASYSGCWNEYGDRVIIVHFNSSYLRATMFSYSNGVFTKIIDSVSLGTSSVYSNLIWKNNNVYASLDASSGAIRTGSFYADKQSIGGTISQYYTNGNSYWSRRGVFSDGRLITPYGSYVYIYNPNSNTPIGQLSIAENDFQSIALTPDEKFAFLLSSTKIRAVGISGNTLTDLGIVATGSFNQIGIEAM